MVEQIGPLLGAAHPIVVNVPPAEDGISIASIVVFAGGVIAALAAFGSAIWTARAADRRLQATLLGEREREEKRLLAERERLDMQFAHEREIVQLNEKRAMVEQSARVVARNGGQVARYVNLLVGGNNAPGDEKKNLARLLSELREEAGVLATRFTDESEVIVAMGNVITALNEALPWPRELPLTEERKGELREKLDEFRSMQTAFFAAARAEVGGNGPA